MLCELSLKSGDRHDGMPEPVRAGKRFIGYGESHYEASNVDCDQQRALLMHVDQVKPGGDGEPGWVAEPDDLYA